MRAPWFKRGAWFAAIWLMSVAVLTVIALILRAAIPG